MYIKRDIFDFMRHMVYCFVEKKKYAYYDTAASVEVSKNPNVIAQRVIFFQDYQFETSSF